MPPSPRTPWTSKRTAGAPQMFLGTFNTATDPHTGRSHWARGSTSLRRTCGLRTRVIPHGNPPGWDEAAGEAGAGWTATHMHRPDRPHGAGPRGGPAHTGNMSSRKPEAKPPRPSLDPKDRWRVYQDLPGRMPTPPQPSALGWRPHPSPPWFLRLPTCPPSRALWAGPAEAERGSAR